MTSTSFGAHNDSKISGGIGVACIYMKDSTTLSSVGNDGVFRNWILS